jgi:uracil-DNA glycosylase family 4
MTTTARASSLPLSNLYVGPEPPRDCPICPRLAAYREENQRQNPDWFNGPAPNFGDWDGRLLIAGLAPGRTGANRTGRPFTGDHAGWLLYETLGKFGFAQGTYQARPDDGLTLTDCMISNAVRCAPPGNKPETSEELACRPFLIATLEAMPRLEVIVTLGDVARRNVLGGPARPWVGDAGGPLSGAQQLPLLAPEHEHGAADARHVRGHFPAGAGHYRRLNLEHGNGRAA